MKKHFGELSCLVAGAAAARHAAANGDCGEGPTCHQLGSYPLHAAPAAIKGEATPQPVSGQERVPGQGRRVEPLRWVGGCACRVMGFVTSPFFN